VARLGLVLAWLAFGGIGGIGLVVTYAVTRAGWRRLRQLGAGHGTALVATGLVFVLTFLGGWLLVLVFWSGRKAYAQLRRPLRTRLAKDAP
jgi:hypothetical protein